MATPRLWLFFENPDAEMAELITQVGYYAAKNDLQHAYLLGLGYTGALNDMIVQYFSGDSLLLEDGVSLLLLEDGSSSLLLG